MKPLFRKDFDSIFRDKLHNYQAQPTAKAWENIAGQLNEVSPVQYYFKWAGMAAGILIFLGTSLFLADRNNATELSASAVANKSGIVRSLNIPTFSSDNTAIKNSATASQNDIAEVNNSHIKNGTSNSAGVALANNSHIKKGQKRNTAADNNITALNEISDGQFLIGETDMGEANYLSAFLAAKLNKELQNELPVLTNLEYRRNSSLDASQVKGLHVGPIVALNNTWILNREIDSRNFDGQFEYKMKFGAAYGFAVGYDFSARSGVEVNWIVNSNEGQAFDTQTELGTKNLKAKLNYTRIPVIFKYRMSKLSKYNATPLAINYLVGVQYGRLNWVNIDERIGFIKPNDFNEHEWGVIFGMEYDFYIGDNYSISLGGRGSVTTDANTFPLLMNDDFSKPHNFSLGISAKFNYLFKPKQ